MVEDAVKYIIFLVDADKLFDTALGMYDFSLVLMVAQHAQKVRISTQATREIVYRARHRTLGNTCRSCVSCERWTTITNGSG